MKRRSRQSVAQERMLIWSGLLIAAITVWQAMTGCEPTGPGASARPGSIHWTARDNSGRLWELLALDQTGAAPQEGSDVDRSKPLVGKVTVQQESLERVGILLQVTTGTGHRVVSLTVAGQQPAAPSLTITDASGQEVARGSFEFG